MLFSLRDFSGSFREIFLSNVLPYGMAWFRVRDGKVTVGTYRSSRMANIPASVTTFRKSAPLNPSDSWYR